MRPTPPRYGRRCRPARRPAGRPGRPARASSSRSTAAATFSAAATRPSPMTSTSVMSALTPSRHRGRATLLASADTPGARER